MILVRAGESVFTVVVTLRAQEVGLDELLKASLGAAPIMAKQPGFISSAIHRGHDGKSTLTYIQWRRREDQEACMASPDFQAPEAAQLNGWLAGGQVEIDVQTYEVVKTFE